jgi:hypothetical protein
VPASIVRSFGPAPAVGSVIGSVDVESLAGINVDGLRDLAEQVRIARGQVLPEISSLWTQPMAPAPLSAAAS